MLIYFLPIFAYLIGSVSSAVIVCKVMGLPDPRNDGSKNPGATNVLRLGGKKAAIITLLGDVLKGVIPVVVAGQFSDSHWILALSAFCAFLGHLYPLYFGFKGGKGVATAIGALSALSALLGLSLVCVWLIFAAITRYSSLAALAAAASSPIMIWLILQQPSYLLVNITMVILLFWRHRTNIQRLLNGTESRISFSKR